MRNRYSSVGRLCGLSLIVVALLLAANPAAAQPDDRPVIRSAADLPRHTYPVSVGSASELLLSDEAFDDLATAVRADLRTLLNDYVVEDAATLRQVYSTLASIALHEGDLAAALEYDRAAKEAYDKQADRLTAGMTLRSAVAAHEAGADDEARHAAFRRAYEAEVAALPWHVVSDNVKAMKGHTQIMSRNLLIGLVQSQYDPAVATAGSLSGDIAVTLIGMRVAMDHQLDYFPIIEDVLGAYITANEVEKEDIWAERDVDLSDAADLHPVVIAVWDSGVDADVFGDQMLRDEHGAPVHLAYAPWFEAPVAPGPLLTLSDEQAARYPQLRDQMKGMLDIQANINSPEADALRAQIGTLDPEQVQPFVEELGLFGNYSHGTHVAGIAVAGNPAARIMTIRMDFPHTMIAPPLTQEVADRWVVDMQASVDLMREHGVRVVTMSWGGSPRDAEVGYEMNGIGETAEERRQMALEVYGTLVDGMTRAMEGAPEILFIPAAGNSDVDVDFSMFMPAGIALPNVLTVAAVDQAGEETSFTSYGGTVRLHASGFQVDSYIPGGDRMKFSGTSMSAPNAANLAAKLLALQPSLTPEEVIDLMLRGADRSEDGRRVLMNPRRTLDLLAGGSR
jgi:hypothetical protein